MMEKTPPMSAAAPEEFWKLASRTRAGITSMAAIDPEKGLRGISTARTQIVLLAVAYALLSVLLLGMETM